MMSQGIYWLGRTVCGHIGLDANRFCVTGDSILQMGLLVLIVSALASALVWMLVRP
jgi:hypothetical protein